MVLEWIIDAGMIVTGLGIGGVGLIRTNRKPKITEDTVLAIDKNFLLGLERLLDEKDEVQIIQKMNIIEVTNDLHKIIFKKRTDGTIYAMCKNETYRNPKFQIPYEYAFNPFTSEEKEEIHDHQLHDLNPSIFKKVQQRAKSIFEQTTEKKETTIIQNLKLMIPNSNVEIESIIQIIMEKLESLFQKKELLNVDDEHYLQITVENDLPKLFTSLKDFDEEELEKYQSEIKDSLEKIQNKLTNMDVIRAEGKEIDLKRSLQMIKERVK